MAVNRITHEQHAAGVLWAAQNKDALERETTATMRAKLAESCGVTFTSEQTRKIASQAGVELMQRVNGHTSNYSGDKTRVLAHHLCTLLKKLGEDVPESLDMIRKARSAQQICQQFADENERR